MSSNRACAVYGGFCGISMAFGVHATSVALFKDAPSYFSTLTCVVGGIGTGKINPHSIGGLLCTWTIRVLAMKYLL